jgi:DNA-binding transcriptional MocR family regulator
MRERLDRLTRLLAKHLPEWSWDEPAGGLSLWVKLPRGDAKRVRPGGAAARRGGRAGSARRRRPEDAPTASDSVRARAGPMREGVERLARAWEAYAGAEKRRTAGVLV